MASDKNKCLEAGMNGHIGKPFELIQLTEEIIRLATKTHMELPLVSNEESLVLLPGVAGEEENSKVLESEIFAIIKNKTKLDVKDALHRFGGSESLYVQSLNMFISDLLKYEREIRSLDNNLVLEIIKPIFHTLKGTSGLLGFVELSALALECEKQSSLLSGKSINIEPIASLLKLMELIRLLLESVFKSESESESESSLGSELKLEPIDSGLMNELRHALETSNMRALDVFKELKQSIGVYSHDLAKLLELQISKLQFKEALGELEKLEKQLSEHNHG